MKAFYCALTLVLTMTTTAAIAQVSGARATEIDKRHYIYIEATGTVEADADLTKITISLSTKSRSAADATQTVSSKIEQFRAALASLGVNATSVQTTNFDFSKVYIIATDKKGVPVSAVPDPNRDQFDGYRSTYGAVITVASTDKVGAILGSASSLGIEVGSVTFATSHQAELMRQAQKLAAEKAHSEAEMYATTLGGTLGDLLVVREGAGYDPGTMEMGAPDGEADLGVMVNPVPAIDVAPGKLSFSATVSAKWELASSTAK